MPPTRPAQTLGTVLLLSVVGAGTMRLAAPITLLLLLLASLPATQAAPFPRRWLAVAQQGDNCNSTVTELPGSAMSFAQASATSSAVGCQAGAACTRVGLLVMATSRNASSFMHIS